MRAKLSQAGVLMNLLPVTSLLTMENHSFPCICTGTIWPEIPPGVGCAGVEEKALWHRQCSSLDTADLILSLRSTEAWSRAMLPGRGTTQQDVCLNPG